MGYGGHSAVLTKDFGQDDRLIGIDRDHDAIKACKDKFKNAPFRISMHNVGFEELESVLEEEAVEFADLFLFDLGFSSPQVDQSERGFSFMRSGPLDMRMDQSQALSAKDVIHLWSEK